MAAKPNSVVQFGETLTRRGHLVRSALTSGPGLLWLTLFLLAPLLAIVFISFLTRGVYGEIQWPPTLENYPRLIGFAPFGSDSLYPLLFLRSLALAALTMALCVVTGCALSFFIAPFRARLTYT